MSKEKLPVEEIKEVLGVPENTDICEVAITPEVAKLLLAYNTNNRKLSDKTVKGLRGQMERGEFHKSNDFISFDDKGVLTNGQHRLTALASANVESIKMGVAFGVSHFADMDTGKRRTLKDNASVLKEQWGINLSEDCLNVATEVITSYKDFASGEYNFKRLTQSQSMDIVKHFEEDLKVCYDAGLFSKSGNKRVSHAPVLAAFFGAYLNGVSLDVLKHVKEVLATGIATNDVERSIAKLNVELRALKGGGHNISLAKYCMTCACIDKVITNYTKDRIILSKDKVRYGFKGVPHVS